jgi:hypothetical protein
LCRYDEELMKIVDEAKFRPGDTNVNPLGSADFYPEVGLYKR